jgi:Uma2 family endonuclease
MMITQELVDEQNISEDVIFPPSGLSLYKPPVETELHLEPVMVLIKCLKWLWKDRTDFDAAGNLSIYYSPN